MKLDLAYAARSGLVSSGRGTTLRLMPNLARQPVAFDGALRHPLRFREAFSALHGVIVSDLRHERKDRGPWLAWKKEQDDLRLGQIRELTNIERRRIEEMRDQPMPADLEREYDSARRTYWKARLSFSDYLMKSDPDLWRLLTPCDPVVTVASDVIFFEAFSKDESAYACLSIDRDGALLSGSDARNGTTNVDYSQQLFDHVQGLRTYRPTRLSVDPQGIELQSGEAPHREEKIDLPDSWLQGFMQVQAAMTLPMRRIPLSRDAVYGALAFLRRHRARKSPRALRFELVPGRPPELVLEPWELRLPCHGAPYEGPPCAPIRTWGKERLLVLARMLTLADSIEACLLGTGLPSFFIVRAGEMRLVLGLSGWTVNDWSKGSALELLAPPVKVSAACVTAVRDALTALGAASLGDLAGRAGLTQPETLAALQQLALAGLAIHDLATGLHRYRPVMPEAVPENISRPGNLEALGAADLRRAGSVKLESRENVAGLTVLAGKVGKFDKVEAVLDGDGVFRKGRCTCSHHHVAGIRRGPCRHLLALRDAALAAPPQDDAGLAQWFARMMQLNGLS